MKTTYSLLFCLCLILVACKTEKKQAVPTIEKEYSLLEKIANASGFENWNNVKELQYTFNVDRDTSHFERKWIWNIKKNLVTSITKNDSISYLRSEVDSTLHAINGGFINDKYWLLAPFNLVWDEGNYTHEHSLNQEAPLSKKEMQKLTIVYGNEGGYTPGDAYDYYFEDDFIIKEWVFRKANQKEPSLATTWEDYDNFDGLKIAQMHQNDSGFKLYFTAIQVK